jgi:4-hydroxythreonine-4-phosphate dehydrogenase
MASTHSTHPVDDGEQRPSQSTEGRDYGLNVPLPATGGMERQAPLPGPVPVPLLVTMGDAAGIGPEIIVRAFAQGELHGAVVVGDVAVMRRAAAWCAPAGQAAAVMTAQMDDLADLQTVPTGCLPVWQPPALPDGLAALPAGQVHARCGEAAARCIEAAVSQVLVGKASGIVTAPVHKEALAAAGVGYPGHTEMLQALAAAPGSAPLPVRMMLANEELRVVLVTIHLSLRKAIEAVTYGAVLETLHIAHRAAAAWGQARPRIAVAGLNPHAGEGGLFGDEEIHTIAPAVAAARAAGLDVSGPYAPDTVFMRARRGEFDLVVAMVHDHGLIPVKYLGVEQGVNVTLGLPLVRTSPDHGTAFDIAGKGVADPASLIAALRMARRLVLANGNGASRPA